MKNAKDFKWLIAEIVCWILLMFSLGFLVALSGCKSDENTDPYADPQYRGVYYAPPSSRIANQVK